MPLSKALMKSYFPGPERGDALNSACSGWNLASYTCSGHSAPAPRIEDPITPAARLQQSAKHSICG